MREIEFKPGAPVVERTFLPRTKSIPPQVIVTFESQHEVDACLFGQWLEGKGKGLFYSDLYKVRDVLTGKEGISSKQR